VRSTTAHPVTDHDHRPPSTDHDRKEPTMPATADDGANAVPEPGSGPTGAGSGEHATELVESDVLVEDVSIDGMCGVY
jgi:mycofactocin precursor